MLSILTSNFYDGKGAGYEYSLGLADVDWKPAHTVRDVLTLFIFMSPAFLIVGFAVRENANRK